MSAVTTTLNEYLAAERARELEAAEAFPGKFDECTSTLGAIRQPLFVCRSCLADPTNGTGAMCYACSVVCHPGCELIELFAKRNSTCQCGTSVFKSSASCRLLSEKELVHISLGKDAHNYFGRFCTCDQPYIVTGEEGEEDNVREKEESASASQPQSQPTSTDMVNCVVCQDWFHEACLESSIPQKFQEIICAACIKDFPFLASITTELDIESDAHSKLVRLRDVP